MIARLWLTYVLRSLRRSGRRPYFAALCVIVGVAAVVALQTAALTVRSALTSNVRASNGGDISVTSRESPLSSTDLRIFQRLQRQGLISQWTAVASLHATAVSPSHTLIPFNVDVISVPPYPIGGEPTFVTPGNGNVATLLRRPGSVLVTSALAEELGIGAGNHLMVNGIGGPGLRATVQGILAATSLERSATMTISRRDAPALSSNRPEYSTVYANAPGSTTVVARALRAKFPLASVQTVQEALQANQQQVHDFQQFLLLAGLLTLLIAGVGILNAMQSMLSSRQLEIAMLKAMGYRPGTLYLLFGGEAFAIGLAGGIVGTALGAVASEVITTAIARAVAVQVPVILDAGTLMGGVLLGVVATLIFAVLPIVRSAALRPLAILRQDSTPSLTRRVPQTLGLFALVSILFAALAAATVSDWLLAFEFVVGAFVACGLLTGLFSLIVGGLSHLGRPSSRATGLLVLILLLTAVIYSARSEPALAILLAFAAIIWGITIVVPERRLFPLLIAARSLSRRRARTSVTLVAFLVGILCMSLTLTVGLTLESQVTAALTSASAVNMVAVANTVTSGAVLRDSAHLPGIKSRTVMTTVTTTPVTINGRPVASVLGASLVAQRGNERGDFLRGVTGWRLGQGDVPSSITVSAGRPLSPADAGTNDVLVNGGLQGGPYNLSTGDRVTLQDTGTGRSRTVTIVGFYDRGRGLGRRSLSSFLTQPVYGDVSLVSGLGGADAQTVVSFAVTSSQLTHDSTVLQRDVPGALVINVNDLTVVVRQILNDLLNVLVVITALAMSAGLAVVGTSVTLAMLERYRELALFKAIGFSPRSVMGFVLVENALGGVVAGAVGVIAVAVALRVLSRVALQSAIGFDPLLALYVVFGAMGLAVGTAYLMSRRAVLVRPVDALRNE